MQDDSVKHKIEVSAEEQDMGVFLVAVNLKLSVPCIEAAAKRPDLCWDW